MDIELVLNELSLRPLADDIFVARRAMSTLLQTVNRAAKEGAARVLRVHRDLNGELLAPDYPVSRWRNDGEVDREARRLFLSLVTKAPFLGDLPDRETEAFGYECFCEGEGATGLGVAWLLDALPVSLVFTLRWDRPSLEIRITELNEDGDLVEETAVLQHAARPEHVAVHSAWFQRRLAWAHSRQLQDIGNGHDLWARYRELFPRLRFCDEVERQLEDIHRGSTILQPILKRLGEFEEYCRNWHNGPFEPGQLPCKATPESPVTLERFGADRSFTYAGEERLFSWHCRLTPGAWRVYFEPDVEEHVFYIGYIGKHLPTVTYTT